MLRLNQNQRIQALTMLARGDNVFNVSRAFGCHRNTIIRLRQRFQQTGGVADRRRPGRPRVTKPLTDRFITLTHLQTAPPQASPATHSAKEALCGTRHRAAHLQWAERHFRWGRQQWARVLFSDESSLTLVIMTVKFEFLQEKGNVLLIIVSLRGTDLEVGVLWYGVALWAKGKQISLLCKATSMLRLH